MNTVFGGMSVGTALIFALILSGVRKGDSVMVGYSISYFFAFIAQFLVIGDIANKTAGEIWVLVSFILSLPIGWIVYQYIHENYDDFVSRYYKYRTAKTDRHGNRLWIAYLGFVEGSIFSYTAFTALGGFFL